MEAENGRNNVSYGGVSLVGRLVPHFPSNFESVAVAQQSGSTQPFPRLEAAMHTGRIWRIAVDSRERFLVTASEDKSARVWDLVTGKLFSILRAPIGDDNEGKLYAIAITPDGSTIAVGGFTGKAGSNDYPIYLFDRATGRMTRRIGGLPRVTLHLAFSLDGGLLAASLGGRNGIRVFQVSDGTEVWRDIDYKDSSYSVEFDRKGRLLATSYDSELRLYGPAPGFKLLAKRSAPGGSKPFPARFSPDASLIAVGFDDGTKVNVLSGDDLRFLYAPDTSQVDAPGPQSFPASVGQQTEAVSTQPDVLSRSDLSPIVVWPQAGEGKPQFWPASTNTIMDLRPLANGGLVFGAQDPLWGALDTQGKRLLGGDPPMIHHRGNESRFRLARDGSIVEFSFDIFADGKRQERLARFELRERRFEVDVSPASGPFSPAHPRPRHSRLA